MMVPSIQLKLITLLLSALTLYECQHFEAELSLEITTDTIVEMQCWNGFHITGSIKSFGYDEITQHGFCWSESPDPSISDTSILLGSRDYIGSFSGYISELPSNTSYYARSFAEVNKEITYGGVKTFTTPDYSKYGKVRDIDGNEYLTVKIGDQTWMAENLETTHYADGDKITHVTDSADWLNLSFDDKAYCWYQNSHENRDTYGALYTWAAMMDGAAGTDNNPSMIQGVCPDGWHVPSDSEWKELEIFLGMSQEAADAGQVGRGTDEGAKLKESGSSHWKTGWPGSPGNKGSNTSCFTALPAGLRSMEAMFNGLGTSAYFWTATAAPSNGAMTRSLHLQESTITRSYHVENQISGYSVRCIKDNQSAL